MINISRKNREGEDMVIEDCLEYIDKINELQDRLDRIIKVAKLSISTLEHCIDYQQTRVQCGRGYGSMVGWFREIIRIAEGGD